MEALLIKVNPTEYGCRHKDVNSGWFCDSCNVFVCDCMWLEDHECEVE